MCSHRSNLLFVRRLRRVAWLLHLLLHNHYHQKINLNIITLGRSRNQQWTDIREATGVFNNDYTETKNRQNTATSVSCVLKPILAHPQAAGQPIFITFVSFKCLTFSPNFNLFHNSTSWRWQRVISHKHTKILHTRLWFFSRADIRVWNWN